MQCIAIENPVDAPTLPDVCVVPSLNVITITPPVNVNVGDESTLPEDKVKPVAEVSKIVELFILFFIVCPFKNYLDMLYQ